MSATDHNYSDIMRTLNLTSLGRSSIAADFIYFRGTLNGYVYYSTIPADINIRMHLRGCRRVSSYVLASSVYSCRFEYTDIVAKLSNPVNEFTDTLHLFRHSLLF